MNERIEPIPFSKYDHTPISETETLITRYKAHGNLKTLKLPDTLDGYAVSGIDTEAIEEGGRLEKIILPRTLKFLLGVPYTDRKSRPELILDPENPYLAITDGAVTDKARTQLMSYCPVQDTQRYVLPEGIRSIGKCAFYGYTGLKEIILSDGLKTIEAEAFALCLGLKRIFLPDTLEEIGEEAFRLCISLDDIALPQNLRKIARAAFLYCVHLENVKWPSGNKLKDVHEDAFFGCPDQTRKIGVIYSIDWSLDES